MTQPAYLREIEDQALIFLRDYALTAYIFFALTHSILARLIYLEHQSNLVVIWLVTFHILISGTFIYRKRMPQSKLEHQSKLTRGVIINILDGFLVASILIFVPFVHENTQMVIVTVMLIGCTGAITTTIGYRRFYLAFTIPIFFSIVVSLLPIIIAIHGIIGLFILICGTVLIISVLYQVSTRIFLNFQDAFAANLKVKKINQELKLAVNSAKQANESKTRFLASASHDLRQPINVLSLFVANLTLKDTKGEYSDIISHMNTAINSVDAQLESLLDISKLDAGVVDVKSQEVNLAKLSEELVSSYPDTDNVEIRYLSEIEDLIVDTDIALIERILNNLVSNAVKYTVEGYIEVSLKCISERALICIKDTGIGIKPKNLENIFDEFYQVDNAERTSANGLGLGLSIVKRLADLLDIEITINSQFGLGTEVILSLNYQRASAPNVFEVEAASIVADSDSKRVLVLDNEIGIVLAVKAVLETMNHRVETFTSSNKALRCFENRRFDLALIDYRLAEGVLGDDVISRMRSINNKTKFFLVTGDNNIEEYDHYEIIHKPVTSKKLEYIFNA